MSQKNALKYMLIEPLRKIVIDGFPRAVSDWEIGPLASCTKNMGDALQNVVGSKSPGTTSTRNVISAQMMKQNVACNGFHVSFFFDNHQDK
jgi:hypothetical protein